MNPKKHIILICDKDCIPSNLNLTEYHVSFITKSLPKSIIPEGFAKICELNIPFSYRIDEYLEFLPEMKAFCLKAIEELGSVWRVVSPMEQTILPGAFIREFLDVPGMKPKDAKILRDKLVMKTLITAASIRTAKFCPFDSSLSAIDKTFEENEYPLILKPRQQAGSRGIKILKSKEELSSCFEEESQKEEFLIETYIDRPILHIDGLVRDGKLVFVTASQYLNTCLEWARDKKAMASAFIDDPKMKKIVVEFANKVISALRIQNTVFHLEAFLENRDSLLFLEIAGRPGGAGISKSIFHRYGVDLHLEALNCDFMKDHSCAHFGFLDPGDSSTSGGWIVTPFPTTEPCEVTKIVGEKEFPQTVWDREIPYIGKRYNLANDEGLPSAKIYLDGDSQALVLSHLKAIADSYRIEVKKIRVFAK